MADAETIMQRLAQVAVDHAGCDDVISDAIALIARLTPREMTSQQACDVLNSVRFGWHGSTSWREEEFCGEVACGNDCHCTLDGEAAVYIAQGLERDAKMKEAANG